MKRKLMLVIPSISSCRAFFMELMEALVHRGWEVHLVTSLDRVGDSPVKLPAQVILHSYTIPRGAAPLALLKSIFWQCRLVARVRPSVIHGHFVVGALLASIAGAVYSVRTIVTFHGLHRGQSGRGWLAVRLERLSCLFADEVEVLTEEDADLLRRSIFYKNKVSALGVPGVGCRLDDFDIAKQDASLASSRKRELGIPADAPVFLFVGRLVEFKGYATAIRAFKAFYEQRGEGCLIVLGAADPLHPDGLNEVEREWAQRCPAVIHVGWQEDVAFWLSMGVALLFPSIREGIPVCVMEAMALGVPPIVVDTRGCRDLVCHKQTGLVVKRSDPGLFLAAMCQLVDHSAESNEMARRTRAHAATHFSRLHYVNSQLERYVKCFAS
jgi:glycosyltransferase involved in cell wall biosynthesis